VLHTSSVRHGLKQARMKCVQLLSKLTDMVRKPQSKLLHKKITTIITLEVHNRDVIERMYRAGVETANDFTWMSQMRYYWSQKTENAYIQQTTTQFDYGCEYIGNCGRLVITPLTDRCYMTLTTALHLKRGGSPEGPAGTGKTETVKDLGKNLAKMVIVFNCSEGLNYKSLGRMFSGLAQTGGWGCFDEFNRIEIEVLSVVAQQIMTILAAISRNAKHFVFQGAEIALNGGMGIFITMNPGYAGRTVR
ncbi:dynein heavy chain, partial [Kipferlia bialata]